MDGSTLQQIRDALLDRREKLGGGLLVRDREAGGKSDLDDRQAEVIDIAQTLEQIERDKSLAEQERRELRAIERALLKIASGTFGICEECEEEIPAKRLSVLPQARLCAKCQAIEEKQQNRTARVSPGPVSR